MAAALKTPTRNGSNAQGVNLTFLLFQRDSGEDSDMRSSDEEFASRAKKKSKGPRTKKQKGVREILDGKV